MKQIFDWLREQMRKHLYTDYTWTDFIEMDDAIRLVNEAEAKWEADCCEWEALGDYHKTWKFCPYCGKPIKISEVE